ncbi:MAG: alpha/beta hydrolase [Verrucomicrobiota bacterium]|nr:alpha/beta hydrolase [Verrucomicrobiota bacterium]
MNSEPKPTARKRARVGLRIAFVLTLLLFLSSLLVFLSAPTAALWVLAILAGEWGHYGAIVAIVLAVFSWRCGGRGVWNAALALITAIIFLTPSLRAARIARDLPARCTAAFGPATNPQGRAAPFRFVDLFARTRVHDVDVTEHAYASDGSKSLKLDLYQERGAIGTQPIVVMIHGGSWRGGNKEELAGANPHLAHEGYAVVAINYRHAPKFPFPAAVDDVFRALDYLKAHASELHLDPTRIALVGRSAGGQIALSAAYSGREPGVRGVVGFYAPADLVLGYNEPSRRWVLDSKTVLENYLRGSPAENPQAYAAASPINFVNASTPPTLLVHGLLDPIVWPKQSEVLTAKLAQAARPHLLLELPWATHGCDANPTGPSGQLSLYAMDRFFASIFAPPPPAP